ncbi:MAG: molybdopterin oxidoreductase family protein [Acidimicrobiales bacterium]
MSAKKRTGLTDLLGLGSRSDDVRYGADERFGVLNETRLPQHWVKTTCGYCSVGCGMEIGVRDGKAISVKGDPDHPVNMGRLCPKGLSEHHTIDAEGRLTQPLLRHTPGGPQTPITWDLALDTLVGRFGRLLNEHGPESVAVLSTGQLVTEEFYTLGKLVRLGFGMAHYDGNTTLCMSSAVSGYKQTFGSDGPPGSYQDLNDADCILLVGANIADNHPLLAPRVLENDEATVIVVDPRVTKTAMVADIHVPLMPRSDITFINGLIKIIIDEGMVDEDYVRNHTEGFSELAAHVQRYDAEFVAAECGISAEMVRDVARKVGTAQRAFVAWTMGVNHSTQGTETVTLLNTLCLITGNIGRAGAAPFSITGQCNAMGTRETGFTASMPGYRAYDNDADRAELAGLWGLPIERIPTQRGRAYPDIIEGVLEGTIKGLWIIATNPPVSFPNRGKLEWALSKLDMLVVQDGYETPTTRFADLVLPAAIWGEKDGTYTNSERRVSRVGKAVEPPGEARSDFDIFLSIAERLGKRDELYPRWKTPEDAFTEWTRVSAGRLCDYSAITWDRIALAGGVQWPCGPETEELGGTPSLYTNGQFPTASGKAMLWPVTLEPIADAPSDQYPFFLNTGRTVEHWHTRTKTGRVDILESLAPEGWVEVNPIDAESLGVKSGERVRLVSRRGQVEGIPVRVTGIVREGEVFVPFHYDELCVNRLTVDEFDPISREPNYKQSAVRIEIEH